MIKSLFLLFLLAISFGAGYFLGAAGTTEIKKSYSTLKDEMTTKTRGLESEVASVRIRLNLIEARDFLSAARDDIKEKNFGEAEVRIVKAKERVMKAISLASDNRKKQLTPIQSAIESIEESIKKLDPKAIGKIEALEKEIEKAAG